MQELIDTISGLQSVAITGMIKNAGKTECLNFILRKLREKGVQPCLTSIGVDGESTDAVKNTKKPEIVLMPGDTFITSENYYRQKTLSAEIREIIPGGSSLGKLVRAQAVTPGKVIISGPGSLTALSEIIKTLKREKIRPMIVDGALSRKSTGGPEITDAMILATGAALSPSIEEIVSKTAFTCSLIDLEEINRDLKENLEGKDTGVYVYIPSSGLEETGIRNGMELAEKKDFINRLSETEEEVFLFVGGAVTDNLMTALSRVEFKNGLTLIVKDFTCLFVSPMQMRLFESSGKKIYVKRKPRLLGITVNPTSPEGYRVDSETLCDRISKTTGKKVFDIVSGIGVSPCIIPENRSLCG